jgi:hypothetical protein
MLSDGHLEIKSFNFVPAFNVGVGPHTPLFEAPQADYADFSGAASLSNLAFKECPNIR